MSEVKLVQKQIKNVDSNSTNGEWRGGRALIAIFEGEPTEKNIAEARLVRMTYFPGQTHKSDVVDPAIKVNDEFLLEGHFKYIIGSPVW